MFTLGPVSISPSEKNTIPPRNTQPLIVLDYDVRFKGDAEAAKAPYRDTTFIQAEDIAEAIDRLGRLDHKTALQERCAAAGRGSPVYEINAVGPDHAKVFTARVLVDGRAIGEGRGRSKKAAEQVAAETKLIAGEGDEAEAVAGLDVAERERDQLIDRRFGQAGPLLIGAGLFNDFQHGIHRFDSVQADMGARVHGRLKAPHRHLLLHLLQHLSNRSIWRLFMKKSRQPPIC